MPAKLRRRRAPTIFLPTLDGKESFLVFDGLGRLLVPPIDMDDTQGNEVQGQFAEEVELTLHASPAARGGSGVAAFVAAAGV